ncbi:MAG: hypothetical protein ICV79_21570 [Flavisolibacter sp.]|nr:hypothetical protein [Flavisolibacter sp.]
MDRRNFLTIRRKQQTLVTQRQRTQSGIQPYTGTWSRNELQHLLKRTLFGSAKADLDYFSNKSLAQIVHELLNPSALLPAPPLNDYNSATLTDPAVQPGQTWMNAPTNDGTINSARRTSFKKWWTGLMIN